MLIEIRGKKGLLMHMAIAKGSLVCSTFVCKGVIIVSLQTFTLMCREYTGKSFGVVSTASLTESTKDAL